MADYDLGTARGKIDIDASGAKKGVNEATRASEDLNKSQKEMSQASHTAGLALAGFGLAAVAAFGVAVKASAEFEKQISAFKAVSGATAEQIDLVREKALQLGADTKFSATEAAMAMEELAKQGLSVEEVLGGAADATVALAAAGEIDLTQAASIAAAALNQFKLEAKDLPHVADLLAGAANASATGVSEIGHALTYVGSVAKTIGFTIEDTAAAIALLANNGIDASKAGTVLRSILTDLSPTTLKAKKAMRDLGIITADGKNQFFDASGKVKSFSEVLDILNKSTAGLTAQQKINTLQMIFGTEALAGISAIAGTTKEEFDELQKSINSVNAADVAATRMDNLAGAIEELSGSFETLLIRAGSQFQVGLTGIVKGLTSVLNFISKLNPEVQKWAGIIVAAAGATALFVGGLILFVDAVQKAKIAFAALNLVISNNPIVRAILIIAALAAAIFAAYKNVQWFRDAVDNLWDRFQPVWDGIKEKAGQVAQFFSSTVVPKITEAWNTIIDTAKRVGAAIADALGPKLMVVWDRLKEAGGTVADFFRNSVAPRIGAVWEIIQEKAGTVVDWFQTSFLPRLQSVWDSVKEGASRIGEGIGPAFFTALRTIQEKAAEVRDWFVTNFAPAFRTVWGQIQSGAAVLKDWFQTDFVPALQGVFNDKIKPAWESFLGWVNTTLRPALEDLGRSVSEGLSTAADTVKGKLEEVAGGAAAGGLGEGIKERIMGVWNGIIEFFSGTVGPAIQNFIRIVQEQFGLFMAWAEVNLGPVFKAIGELISAIWTEIGPKISEALETIKTVLGVFVVVAVGLWTLFGESIINLVLAAWGIIRGVIEGALKIITGIIQIATAIISGDWGKAWEGILNILHGILQIIFAVVSGVMEAIVGVISGILNGIRALWDAAWNAAENKVREIFNSIVSAVRGKIEEVRSSLEGISNFIKSIFNIDLYGIGRNIIQSFLNGLKSMFGQVQDAFNWLTDKIPDWKGPPQKDEKLLVENGRLIMQSLVDGLQDGWKNVEGLLVGVTNEVAPAVGASSTNNSTTINVNFGDVNGAGGQEIKATLSDSNLLRQITNAARAGVGGMRK